MTVEGGRIKSNHHKLKGNFTIFRQKSKVPKKDCTLNNTVCEPKAIQQPYLQFQENKTSEEKKN